MFIKACKFATILNSGIDLCPKINVGNDDEIIGRDFGEQRPYLRGCMGNDSVDLGTKRSAWVTNIHSVYSYQTRFTIAKCLIHCLRNTLPFLVVSV